MKVEIRNSWLLQSRGCFTGCITVDLDKYIGNPAGKWIILDASGPLMNALSLSPDTLTKDVINILGIDGTYSKDFETWRLMELGDTFLDLIKGKIDGKSNNSDFMPGCGKK